MDSRHKKSITLIVISIVIGFTIFSVAGFSVVPSYEPLWTVYLHDENHTGVAVNSTIDSFNIGALRPLYRHQVYGQAEFYYSSNVMPGASGSVVGFGLKNGSVMLLDSNTGSYLGAYSCGSISGNTEALGAATIDDRGVVYIGCGSNGVHAINGTTLANIWIYNFTAFGGNNWTETSPVVVNGIVYTASYNTSVVAINSTNGQNIWSFGTGDLVVSSPAVVNGVVYINSLDNQTYALNATNGSKIWNTTTGCTVCGFGMLESSPTYSNGIVYVGSDNNQTYGLNASNGSKIWNFTLNGPVGHSSPIIANGIVYIGSKTGRIYALNASNGSKIWQFNTQAAVEFPGAYANGLVYFGSDDHKLYVLDVATGSLKQSFDLVYPVSAPVIAGDKVYARTYGNDARNNTIGTLHAFTPDYDWEMFGRFSGQSRTYPGALDLSGYANLWNFSLPSGSSSTSVAIANIPQVSGLTAVFIGGTDNQTYALNATNGAKLWNFTTNGSLTSPAFATYAGGSMVVVGSADNQTYALNATNGAKLWNFTTAGSIQSSPIFATINDNASYQPDNSGTGYIQLKDVIFVAADKQVYALNPSNGAKLWNFTLNGTIRSTPSLTKLNGINYLFVGSDDNQTYALNAISGLKIWNYTTGDVVVSSSTSNGFYIHIGSNDRQLYALNITNGVKIWNFTTNGSVRSSPTYGNIFGTNMVFVGSDDNQTYALDSFTGSKIWNFTTGGNVTSSPALLGINEIAITSADGKLYFLNASTGALIKNFTLDGPSVSSPAVGRVMISGIPSDFVVVGGINKFLAFGTLSQGGSSVAVTSITPSSVNLNTGLANVSILGSGFQTGAKAYLTIGGVPFYNFTNIAVAGDGNSLNATINTSDPLLTASPSVGVNVTNLDGSSANTFGLFAINGTITSLTEWTMFRLYANHTSWDGNSYPIVPGLNYATFNASLGTSSSAFGDSSPAVANGYMYIGGGWYNQIYQLNASNVSKLIANFTTLGPVGTSSPAVANGYVYIGSNGSQVYQLNASNVSKLIANFTTLGPVGSSPAVANGYVYIGSDGMQVYQLNASNISQLIANFTTGRLYRSSPAVANGYVYIGTSDNQTYQLNASNISQKIANFTTLGLVQSSPAVANGYVYIASNDHQIYQLNDSNISQKIANFTLGGFSGSESSPAVANGYVYIGSSNNQVYQLNASNISQLIANFTTGATVKSSPAVANGYVYVGSWDKQVYQLNASNISQKIANFTTSGSLLVDSSPAVANGYLYIYSFDNSIVYQLNASNISRTQNFVSDSGSGGSGNYGCFNIVNQTMCESKSGCQWKSAFNFCGINENSLTCDQYCDACKNQTGCSTSLKAGGCIWEVSYNKCHENFTSFTYGSGGSKTTDYYVNFTPPICVNDPTVCSSLFNSTRGYIKQEVCNNNVDDNGDGLIDCVDSMCFGRLGCTYNASLDNTSPQIINSRLDISNDTVMFNWFTDRPTNSSLKFFNSSVNCVGTLIIYNETSITTDHHIYLDSFVAVPGYPIQPNKTYYYKLNGTSLSNRTFETICLNLTTLFGANKTIPFAVNTSSFSTFRMDFGSGYQIFNANDTLSLNATSNFKMSIPFSGGSEITFSNMSLLASKSFDFTNTFAEQSYLQFGGKTGFAMNSDKFAEMKQALGLKDSDNITITIPSVGQRIYKCASESTGTNCIDVTSYVTILGNNGTHTNVSFPVSLGFSSYISAGTAALDIWSENDTGKAFANKTKYAGSLILFYANYTNISSGINITGATCMFNLTGAVASNMSYNDTTGLYFINKTVASAGTTLYTVNCTATGHTSLNTTANVTLTTDPSSGGSQTQLDSNGCGKAFCLNNAFNTSGNQTIKICAGTSTTVRDFNIWYNGTGPFNLTGASGFVIIQANYTNSTGNAYDNNLGLNNVTGGKCVNFVLNGTLAPFTALPIQINATAYNLTNYGTAASQCASGSCNGTMFTINYISVLSKYPNGANVPNSLIMVFNNVSKAYEISGPAMTDDTGYYAQHCLGVVSGTNCTNATGGTFNANKCAINGIPFPTSGTPQPSGSRACDINSTKSLIVFDFVSSNASQVGNLTPNTTATFLASNASVVGFVMTSAFSNSVGFSQYLNVTSTEVLDDTGVRVYYSAPEGSSNGPKGGAPFFLLPNTHYLLRINITGYGVYTYPYMAPVSGISGVDIIVPNMSSTSFTTFIGKVVNESGSAVPNATVYVQYAKNGGSSFGIQLINSSVTDANGRFVVSVPVTNNGAGNPFPVYQFYIIGSNTTNGVPIYFPTVDNNNGRGYYAQGSTAILSPMKLKAGGRVDVTVTLNGASLVLSELSKIQTLGTGDSRLDVTGKFNMLSIFDGVSPPVSLTVSLLSPVSTSRVYYNVFGKNESFGGQPGGEGGEKFTGACTNSVTVSQGAVTPSNCVLTSFGSLNLSVANFGDILNISGFSTNDAVSNYGFWYDTNLVLRDVNRNVTLYLSPGGNILQDLLGYGSSGTRLRILVPAGNYSIDLIRSSDNGKYLSVYNRSNISIPAGITVNYTVKRSALWQIKPQFPSSLSLSSNTTLFTTVFSPQGANGGRLNDSNIVVKGHVLYLDKSNATAPGKTINFTYNGPSPGTQEGFRGIFNATALGLTAGKYWILLNATNVSTDVSYESTTLVPVSVFDFSVGLDIGGFSFGAGQNISAKIFAYDTSSNPPIGINATGASNPFIAAPNVSIAIYDPSGTMATGYSYNASSVINGDGSANITLPSTVGYYNIVSIITSTNGKQGVFERWVQVSTLNVKTTSDKQSYQPTDTVILTVQVLNSSNSAGISGASVEIVVDGGNTPAIALTGSDGKANIKLDPSTYSSTGQWQFGFRNVKIRVSKDTGIDVIKLENYYGFEVKGFQSFVKTDKFSYSTSENVTVQVFLPPGITTSDVKAIVDGNSSGAVSGTAVNTQYWTINLGTKSVGHHNVEVRVTAGGGIQSFFTGFDVSSYIVKLSTDKFSYSVNENVTVTATVSYPNGTAVSNKNVSATLFKSQPPNDINISYSTANTSSAGVANIILNASKGGFNYIRVDIDGQSQFIGLQVSSLAISLLNSPGGTTVTNYNTAPGSNITIYINATSGGANVPNGSVVTATIWAFGNPITLPINTTINGNSSIPIQIPSNAPAQIYGLDVKVTTPSGEQGFALPSTLTVTGGNALHLKVLADRNFQNPYTQNENATFTLTLTYPNNTGVLGENVTLEIGSKGSKSVTVGTAATDSTGLATFRYNISTNDTDGEYFIHGFITNNTDVQSYGGYLVSSLGVTANLSNSSINIGGTTTLSVSVVNKSSGSSINATSGSLSIFLPNKGEIVYTLNVSGTQPYTLNISVPNESSAVGTYPMKVDMFLNSSQVAKSLLLEVRNVSHSLNLTLPSSIIAGTSFLANLTSTLNGTPSLVVFSPSAESVAYENKSVTLGGSNLNASLNITINTAGVYIVRAFQNGVGTTKSVITVTATTNIPLVWLQNSSGSNVTNYTTSQDVYIFTNVANATATIITFDNTTNSTVAYSVLLNQINGTSYYGILSNSNLVSGRTYFVRIDTSTAIAVANKIFKVL